MNRAKLLNVSLSILLAGAFACNRESTVETGTTTRTGTEAAQTATAAPGPTTPRVAGTEEAVPVSLVDYRIEMPNSLPAGTTVFQISNNGEVEHNFEIEGNGIERKLDQPLKPLEVASLEVNLQPGTYEVYCPVGDHAEERQMRTQLVVTAARGNLPQTETAADTVGGTGR